jgi:glycosyltransferase involved in cell wall biosynthesis
MGIDHGLRPVHYRTRGSAGGSFLEKQQAFQEMAVLIVDLAGEFAGYDSEAFLCGMSVVASNIGGMAELVDDGWNGLLFKVGGASGRVQ